MKFKTDILKTEPKVKHFKLKIAFGILILFLILTSVYGFYSFFTTYGLRTPIILQNPVYKLNPNVIISPVGKKKTSIKGTFDIGAIADKIYTLESSNGKNDGCNRLGKFNGYGYRQNTFEWICYDSHEEVRMHVINWLTKHIKNGDIESALCLYNQGKITNDCTYAVNFNSL